MRPSRRSLRVITYGAVGAVIGAVVFTVIQAIISANALSLVNGLVLGLIVGFVIGILPAAERDDQDKQDQMERARHGHSGPADATFEGQEARDLAAKRDPVR
jgi:F0F1-type ATP synthase assembly protein I